MPKCPSYYLLADGTEFVDFFHEECSGWLISLHPSAQHAIQSAMEHRFRMGWKTADTGHDITAMTFWTAKALEFIRRTMVDQAARIRAVEYMEIVTKLVDIERDLKLERETNVC